MTTTVRQNIYAAWLDGDVTAIEALRSLCADYEEVEQSYKDFERIRDSLRDQISQVVEKLGGRAEIKGFGKLTITEASIVAGFDKEQLRALVSEFINEDRRDIADRVAACAKNTMRVGGLRIEREKPAR